MFSSKLYLLLITLPFLTGVGFSVQTQYTVEINKVNFNYYTPDFPVGMFTVNFMPDTEGVYLSIGAQNNSTGQFDIIVSNLYLPSNEEAGNSQNPPNKKAADSQNPSFTTFFDLSKIAQVPYTTPFDIIIYVHILKSIGFYPFDPSTHKATLNETVTEVNYNAKGVELPENFEIDIMPALRPGHTVGDPMSDYRYRSKAPNLDLDDSQNGDSGSFAGDLNACVPTATANSLKWMEQTYTSINLDGDLRETMEELSELMQRENNKGTFTDKMILGKLDFIEEYELPVEVKFQAAFLGGNIASTSGNSLSRNFNNPNNPDSLLDPPTWDFLKQMVKDGEDVEINYTWYNEEDSKWYAHSVNVTGINEFESGVKKIAFKHDSEQLLSGGLLEEIHQITVDSSGWMRFGPDNTNIIKDVVAESPVIPDGQETAAVLAELFALGESGGGNKVYKNNGLSSSKQTNEFVEIIINQNYSYKKYRLTVYSDSGRVIQVLKLDSLTTGETQDSFAVKTFTFTGDVLPDTSGAIGLAYSGSPIPNTFISWGGVVTAIEGDWTDLSSTDIGITPTAGKSFALSGTGTDFQNFSWINTDPSPGVINPSITITDVKDETMPREYRLYQNYPNPFNPSTIISYSVPVQSHVTLTVYNVLGQRVAEIVNETKTAGNYKMNWNASDLASGIYIYTLRGVSVTGNANFYNVKKMVLIK